MTEAFKSFFFIFFFAAAVQAQDPALDSLEGDLRIHDPVMIKQGRASLLNVAPLYVNKDGWPTAEPTGKYFKMADFQQKAFSGT